LAVVGPVEDIIA